jgi:serine/threonine-protein phosphatase 5
LSLVNLALPANPPLLEMATADVEAATALKLKGNKAFAEHDWPRAIDYYTQAIEKNDRDASFFCNRAQAGLRRTLGTRPSANLNRRISSLNLTAMLSQMPQKHWK